MSEKQVDYVEEFKTKRSSYESFCERLKNLIEEILKSNNIEYQSIEYRTKTVDGFSEKISRAGKNYVDPLKEITDIIGLRVILYYADHVEKVASILRSEFIIDELNSINKSTKLAENEFGYLSFHLIFCLSNTRSQLPEWKSYAHIKAEVQIRTVLQHSWAAIDHKLRYKTDADIPSELKRPLYRLSGLLELADEQFIRLRDAQQNNNSKLEVSLGAGKANVELNADSLRAFLAINKNWKKLESAAIKIGFKVIETRMSEAHLSQAVNLLLKGGVLSVSDFENLIVQNSDKIHSYLVRIFGQGPWTVSDDFLALVCSIKLFTSKVNRSDLLKNGWNDSVLDKVINMATEG